MAVHHGAVILALLAACHRDEGSTGTDPSTVTSVPTAPEAQAGPDVRAHVGDTVALDGSASTGEAFTWQTSDGRTFDGAVASVPFDAPGHYTAVLEVRDALGRVDTDSVAVTVTWPRAEVPPVAASALVGDGGVLWVALEDFDAVAEIDVAGRTVQRWVEVCDGPRSVAVGHGAVWVACGGDDQVARIADGVAAMIPLPWGSHPFGVVARGDDVLVTLQGAGAVAQLAPDGTLLRTVPALPDVRGLAATADRVVLSRWRSPDAGGEVLLLDADLGDPQLVSLRVDPGPDSDTNARGLPNLLARPVVRPDGRVVALPGSKANIERGLFREGRAMTFETTVRADLRQVSLVDEVAELDAAVFDDRDHAQAAAYTPDGDWLLVLHRGVETVDVLDAYTLARAGGAGQGLGRGGEALWVSPDGAEAWVYAALSRELAVLDLSVLAAPNTVATVPLVPPSGEVVDETLLAGRILFGRSADPRMSTGGYLSCEGCHPEGEHDGRTWDFTDRGEGLRNTISLRGRGGAAPIHWSANFDELQDFENDIRGPQSGRGFLDDADFADTDDPLGAPKAGLSPELDALAAYVASLDQAPRSPYREPDGAQTAQAALGAALFVDPAVGCAECHPLPQTSDSAWLAPGVPLLHDVGTLWAGSGSRRGEPLVGLDTPPLQGLWGTAPYLHDGSAATVREAVLAHDLPEVALLDDDAVDALARYLLELE
ncbi:MAG: PKD domain-containing protein [Myxococcota bacterium]